MSELIEKPQTQDLAYYCKCFANLNVNSNKSRGKSPHKPILLLSVLELIAQGLIVNNRILVSDQLIEIFNRYWNNFVEFDSGHQGGIHCPFTHLRRDGFWHLKAERLPILVARDLEDDSPHNRSMKNFHNESISLPSKEQYFPRLEALEWHRKNKFKA